MLFIFSCVQDAVFLFAFKSYHIVHFIKKLALFYFFAIVNLFNSNSERSNVMAKI